MESDPIGLSGFGKSQINNSKSTTSLRLEMYGSLFDSADDAIYILDKEGKFIMVNKGAEQMYGFSLEEFIGKTPADVSAEGKNDLEYLSQRLEDAINGIPQQIDFWGVRKNGEIFPKIVKLYPGVFKGEKVVTAFAIDITDRKRAEQEIEKRLVYERIISKINQLAINPGEMNLFINQCLNILGIGLQVSRVYVFKKDYEHNTISNTHEWVKGGILSQIETLQNLDCEIYRDWMDELQENRVINYSNISSVTNATVRELLSQQQIKSILVVPMFVAERFDGFLGFDECDDHRNWEDTDVTLLKTVAQIIANSIDHYISVQRLVESQRNYKTLYNLLRSISDNLTDMLWAKDLNKEYIFSNKAICDNLLNAASTDEPLGKNDMFFAERERQKHPENNQWHTFGEVCQDSDQVIIDSKKPGQFDEYGNVKGAFLFLDVHKAPLLNENGEMIGIVGSARDVTRIKAIQQKLQESEDKFRNIFQSVSDGVVYVDRNGKILNINQALLDITKLKKEKIVGRNAILLVKELISFSQIPSILKKVRLALKGHSIEPFEIKYDSSYLEISTSYDTQSKNITGIIRDITKRKKEEEELSMYREKLEELVKARTSELEAKNKELERFNELFVGREFRIKELKDQIRELKKQID